MLGGYSRVNPEEPPDTGGGRVFSLDSRCLFWSSGHC